MNCLLRLFPALLFLCPVLTRAANPFYAVAKFSFQVQTGPAQLSPNPDAPFQFVASSTVSGILTSPGGVVNSLTFNLVDSDFELAENYGTQALMDASFPSGDYTITPTVGTAGTVDFTGDGYPPAPQVINASWNEIGELQVDPTKSYTFQFNAFTGYTTLGAVGQVQFAIDQVTPAIQMFWETTLSALPPTGYTIPAGTLTAGGTYVGRIDYVAYPVFDTTTLPGIALVGGYGRSTQFVIYAVTPAVNAPVIVSQPSSQTVSPGSTVLFTFAASSTPPPTYQWYFNGISLGDSPGTLEIQNAGAANAGSYYCVATNASGSVRSNTVTLALNSSPDIGRLVNLSCRAQVGTGANILIAGFAVGGGSPGAQESLLVRGSGPALAPFGVAGTLPDPLLQEFSGPTLEKSDNGWNGDAQIASTASQVHAFAWYSGSKDSALLISRGDGPYTAQISGDSGDTGVALAEVYDATPAGTYSSALPRLVNLSARVQVGTGGDILIAGFVIGGSTARTVLIRASGPALAGFGVAGALPDPQLQLFSGTTLLASQSGWGGAPALATAFSSVGAFAWDPASRDSAIFVTLAPGAYTAQVSGASGDSGVALVEVYEVP